MLFMVEGYVVLRMTEEKVFLEKRTENSELDPVGLTRQILFATGEGNEYYAVNLAEQLIHRGLLGLLKNPVTEWKFYILRFLTLLSVLIARKGIDNDFLELQIENCMKEIENLETVHECEKFFIAVVRASSHLNENAEKSYSPLVNRIREQVMTDLKQPLTLQYFAELLNVNSSYLSNLFRQQTGVTITEYVTDKRITHAANLLAYTQYPIKNIAKQVGIPDVQYFSRLFKKRMGITPTQYREEVKEDKI